MERRLLFFRITSDLIPFASHPVCKFNWQKHYQARFQKIGGFIKEHDMRISMHPDQFVLINSPDRTIHRRAVRELEYHAEVLDFMGLDEDAKIQIHVGGVYGNKPASTKRFISRYKRLPRSVKRRLVIENDDRLYSLADCVRIYEEVGVPVVLDYFHHSINYGEEYIDRVFDMFADTWGINDGVPMVDYSSQAPGERVGTHAQSINIADFKKFLENSMPFDFDVMLEIKDKEASALKALKAARSDPRLN
jgi:UV DNA damage endonuclease